MFILRLLPGTLSIALTFVVVALAFTGIGLALRRGFGLVEVAVDDCIVAFWMGFATVILFLLLWNFSYPVGAGALTVVLLSGAAGLGLVRAPLGALVRSHRGRRAYWTVAVVLLAGCWIANLATGSMSNWDTSLYHMQGVRWANSYPAVPGLANLFGPLGFNNATFLYDAMLDAGPWAGRAWHVANGVLVFALVAQALVSGARLLIAPATGTASDMFAFLLLAPALDLAVTDPLTSFVPDLGLTAIRFATVALWFRLLQRKGTPASDAYGIICLSVLSAAAVTIKMNAVVFAAAMLVTAAAVWFGRATATGGLRARALQWSVVAAVAFGLAWGARGVVLSGYPAFPSQFLAAPVEWRAPAAHAQAEFDYVVHSTRVTTGNVAYITGEITGYRAWLPRWLQQLARDPYNAVVPVILILALLPFLLVGWRRAPPEVRAAALPGWWLVLPSLIGLVAWIAVAPAPRYAAALFWTVPALLGAQLFALCQRPGGAPWIRWLGVAALAAGISPPIVDPLVEWRRAGAAGSPIEAILHHNLEIPPQGQWYRGPMGQARLQEYQTASGLRLLVPEHRCWDSELPCTPNPAPNLRLRVPGRIERGFVVDGEWQMLHWPEPWKGKFRAAWEESRRRAHGAK